MERDRLWWGLKSVKRNENTAGSAAREGVCMDSAPHRKPTRFVEYHKTTLETILFNSSTFTGFDGACVVTSELHGEVLGFLNIALSRGLANSGFRLLDAIQTPPRGL